MLCLESEFSRRERLLKLLLSSEEPLTPREIAEELDLTEKEVYRDLEHVARSLKARSGGSMWIEVLPPQCLSCGFTFSKKPWVRKSKCPRCKSTHISQPRIRVGRR